MWGNNPTTIAAIKETAATAARVSIDTTSSTRISRRPERLPHATRVDCHGHGRGWEGPSDLIVVAVERSFRPDRIAQPRRVAFTCALHLRSGSRRGVLGQDPDPDRPGG